MGKIMDKKNAASVNSPQMDPEAGSIPVDNTPMLEETRYTRIQTRLAIAFAVLAAVITTLVAVLFYFQARSNLFSQFQERVLSLASIAQLQQSPNLLTDIKSVNDQDTSIYKFLQQQLSRIVDSDPTLGSAYIMRQSEIGTIYYIVESVSSARREANPPAHFGDLNTSAGPVLLNTDFANTTQPVVENNYHTDTAGTWLSAYAPIYKDDGTLVGVLGLDLSASAVLTAQRNMLLTTLLILAVFLPLFAGAGWILGNRLARPIVELTAGAKRIAAGDLEYKVTVKSGDEIELLGKTFNVMTDRVNDLVSSLEQRVEERTFNLTTKTHELEAATYKLENRASQLTAVSVVARAVTTMRDVNRLLPEITSTISRQFGFYHVGIFLNDSEDQYTVLKAANSRGGTQMLAQGHSLKIGQVGIVGNVANTGTPRIALDTGEDAVFFNNPNLPETKSEMALPLRVGERIIGVLDVQSTESGAFKPEDEEILSILADQVSIAIENASLFEEAQSIIHKFVETSWQYFLGHSNQHGYQFTNNLVQPLSRPLERPEITAALESGQVVSESTSDMKLTIPTLAIPIKVRGEVIGVIDIRSLNSNRKWDKADMTAVQTIGDRLAFALDNARLIEETQRRVSRERAISDMTSKIGSSVDVNTILQQTVQELGRLIGNSEVVIQLSSGNDQLVKE
jgi:GAF domain-containing protein/HAMP domain-containing protein